jgi:cytochrome c oxidase cbb3-type subunit 3
MSGAWSWYVIAIIVLNIAGCGWLLWWTAKRRPGDPKPEDTSHVWDGDLTEYNKPLPKWWINCSGSPSSSASVPALVPGMGSYAGYGKWSSKGEHAQQKAAYDATLESTFAPFKGQPINVLATNADAVKLGRRSSATPALPAMVLPRRCDRLSQPQRRHLALGRHAELVLQTVLDGREGVMPEWGTVLTGMGGNNAVDYVVAYVRTLSKRTSRSTTTTWRPRASSCTTACAWLATAPKARATRPWVRPT